MIGQAYCCEQLTHVCSTTAIQRPQLLLCMQWFRNFDFVKRLNCYNCSQHDHELVVVHSRSASMSACEYCAMLLGRLRCPCGGGGLPVIALSPKPQGLLLLPGVQKDWSRAQSPCRVEREDFQIHLGEARQILGRRRNNVMSRT